MSARYDFRALTREDLPLVARWLEAQPAVARVHYPGLPSHPQHDLAMGQQSAGGAVLSFELKGGREAAWRLIDATRLISITANLGFISSRYLRMTVRFVSLTMKRLGELTPSRSARSFVWITDSSDEM